MLPSILGNKSGIKPNVLRDVTSVIFVNENENENSEKRENNEFVNEN